MADLTPEEIRHHVKTYVIVFVALAFFTVVTVAISYLDLGVGASVVLALGVASVKGALVASYFMHLIDEKITIYWTLLITAAMFLILMLLPLGNMLAQTKI
ncbi:MAG: cytochrome C oxidase subunit IV family protein [Candidatus Marinimicrobia bacterium]|jgi:cytochrome c oxidase subunit 4|nr:cytochrome C oxidase subunit IV family protein [Candidatus Neomarinimicrobiota bacterium]MBT3676926.1 cytochrome C oxidase subunit IV family protein [Candidatus Neomarinimicrobiota bacterium]MBT3763007.1 cytochrome C oxidase subunit IV family protein [Candidatus Neomarinimicrobiota bacterium]MBT4068145.1 cytochrome C oxidase subunit IV family protein [Candidatus Neomarinimicrobiota bacterium]MBT4270656.1 cytochrome C oxidase subunit IV family protein [Candidatus Neomarinimicrobiota bacterium